MPLQVARLTDNTSLESRSENCSELAQFKICPNDYSKLKKLSKEFGVSIATLLRWATREWLDGLSAEVPKTSNANQKRQH